MRDRERNRSRSQRGGERRGNDGRRFPSTERGSVRGDSAVANGHVPPGPIPVPQGPPLIAPVAATIPTLHAVMTGEVKLLTPKGALMELSDGRPIRFLNGLLRRRTADPVMKRLNIGSRLFVKVARIEPGMVLVDNRGIDEKTGQDLDPSNIAAEVEEWVDVPAHLVGRVIGRQGANIRKFCEDSGADLRFDTGPAGPAGVAAPIRGSTGAGGDLAAFLAEAKADNTEAATVAVTPQVDKPQKEAGDDLRSFLAAMRGDGESEEGEDDKEEREIDPEDIEPPKDVERMEAGFASAKHDAIRVEGAVRLTKKHFAELFAFKELPEMVDFKHVGKAEVICIFKSTMDAAVALHGLSSGFADLTEDDCRSSPVFWHAKYGQMKYSKASSIDLPEGRTEGRKPTVVEAAPGADTMRLRVNGDAMEVRKALSAVRELIAELSKQPHFPRQAPTEQDTVERMRIPTTIVGRVVGKGGETIRRLEAESGARIKIFPTPEDQEGATDQELLIRGSLAAVRLAQEKLEPILEGQGKPRRSSSSPDRRRPRSPEVSFAGNSLDDRRGGPERAMGREPLAFHSTGSEAPEARGRARSPSQASSAPSSTTRARRRQEARKAEARAAVSRTVEKSEDLRVKRQRKLDHAAQLAEEAAASWAAAAKGGEDEMSVEEDGPVAPQNMMEDDNSDCAAAFLGRPAATPYGHGRLSRIAVDHPSGLRFATVRLLAGGTISAPESSVMAWVAEVERRFGDRVLPPVQSVLGSDTSSAVPKPAAMVVASAEDEGKRLMYRLVPVDGSAVQFVDISSFAHWRLVDAYVYLVELCTTPASLRHVVPCLHDHRQARQPAAKGDLVVIDGQRPGTSDLGTVLRVVGGRAAAAPPEALVAAASASRLPPAPRRAQRRAVNKDKALREGAAAALESSVLPLLASRLPPGVEALGVGASLDGSFLRVFLRMPVEDAAGAAAGAAAAAGLGAMLGCEIEVLASSSKAPVEKPPDGPKIDKAAGEQIKDKAKKEQLQKKNKKIKKIKEAKPGKKKKKKKKDSSSSST